jgi:hypothetical protein
MDDRRQAQVCQQVFTSSMLPRSPTNVGSNAPSHSLQPFRRVALRVRADEYDGDPAAGSPNGRSFSTAPICHVYRADVGAVREAEEHQRQPAVRLRREVVRLAVHVRQGERRLRHGFGEHAAAERRRLDVRFALESAVGRQADPEQCGTRHEQDGNAPVARRAAATWRCLISGCRRDGSVSRHPVLQLQ